jgi:hypothetical protein
MRPKMHEGATAQRSYTSPMRAGSFLVASWMFAVLLGTVADRTTGQPLPGVHVALGSSQTTSHADGSFRLTGLKAGHATLLVSSDDVPPQHFPVVLNATTTHIDLRVCSTTLDYNCGPPQY